MPVPQRVSFLVRSRGWAGEPAQRRVIENGVRCELKPIYSTILKNRQDACSTRDEFSCGTGILPVHKTKDY
jgi:hypothetical protein